jgi:hypothetical protein
MKGAAADKNSSTRWRKGKNVTDGLNLNPEVGGGFTGVFARFCVHGADCGCNFGEVEVL